jgi:hypothetical protein
VSLSTIGWDLGLKGKAGRAHWAWSQAPSVQPIWAKAGLLVQRQEGQGQGLHVRQVFDAGMPTGLTVLTVRG